MDISATTQKKVSNCNGLSKSMYKKLYMSSMSTKHLIRDHSLLLIFLKIDIFLDFVCNSVHAHSPFRCRDCFNGSG